MKERRIWKYPLVIASSQEITVPSGARLLSVINQGNHPTLYYLVNPHTQTKTRRQILILGTGHSLSQETAASFNFIGTITADEFVWHIFEQK